MGSECAVCAPGYGRGVANACHECTATFRGGMYFVMAVGLLLTVVVALLLAVYLVRQGTEGRAEGKGNITEWSADISCILLVSFFFFFAAHYMPCICAASETSKSLFACT